MTPLTKADVTADRVLAYKAERKGRSEWVEVVRLDGRREERWLFLLWDGAADTKLTKVARLELRQADWETRMRWARRQARRDKRLSRKMGNTAMAVPGDTIRWGGRDYVIKRCRQTYLDRWIAKSGDVVPMWGSVIKKAVPRPTMTEEYRIWRR